MIPIMWFLLIGAIGVITSAIFIGVVERVLNKNDWSDFLSGIKGFYVFASIVTLIWVSAFWVIPLVAGENPEDAGPYGDMFGVVTSLFSGLAFAGLISTILMQRKDLELQRDDLKLSRNELELSRNEYRLQRFENTLFGLLRMFNDHVTSLENTPYSFLNSERKSLKGRDVLEFYATKLPDQFYKTIPGTDDYGGPLPEKELERELHEQISLYVEQYHMRYERDLGPYFRLLYNIIRHIDHAELSMEEKLKYSKIVRAYLSSPEIKLLMFNCASPLGEGLTKWVTKYKLLKHLVKTEQQTNPNIYSLYPPETFS